MLLQISFEYGSQKLYTYCFVWYITNIINVVTVRNFGMDGKFSILYVCSGVNRTLDQWINKLFN